MGWEWRCFFTPVVDFSIWKSLSLSPQSSVTRSDTYLRTTPSVGLKLRGGNGLELKVLKKRGKLSSNFEKWKKHQIPLSIHDPSFIDQLTASLPDQSELKEAADVLRKFHNISDSFVLVHKTVTRATMSESIRVEQTNCRFEIPEKSVVELVSVACDGSDEDSLKGSIDVIVSALKNAGVSYTVMGYPEALVSVLEQHSTTNTLNSSGTVTTPSNVPSSTPTTVPVVKSESDPIPSDDPISKLLSLGQTIRQLKAEKADKKVIGDHVKQLTDLKQKHEEDVWNAIQKLENEWNDRLLNVWGNDENHPEAVEFKTRFQSIENLLPPATLKAKREEVKRKVRELELERLAAFDRFAFTEGMLCQRKIHHLLDHNSGKDEEFCYYRRLNPRNSFQNAQQVWLTEKMDGTTVQATNKGIFKRFDIHSKATDGNVNWHELPEEQRYRLERLNLEDPQHHLIGAALSRYQKVFENLPDDLCVYFEAIGERIGSRFAHLPEFYDISVFDFSRNGKFCPFEETILLCKEYNLPIVAHQRVLLDYDAVISFLSGNPKYTAINADLEGYVVRSIDSADAAKIRVADVPVIRQ